METISSDPAPPDALLDFSDSVGSFYVLTRTGKLDALSEVAISPDYSRATMKPASLDLDVVYPLVAKIKPSTLILVIHAGARPRIKFLMSVNAGNQRRTISAVGTATEIITRALDNDTLPILVQAELEEAVAKNRGRSTPVQVPIRIVELRSWLPDDLLSRLRNVVLANTKRARTKGAGLTESLAALRRELRKTLINDYMMKCLWLDVDAGLLGNIVDVDGKIEFAPFDVDDDKIVSFLCALEKDIYGDFQLDFREFANVIPAPKRGNPWLGPSVHVFKAEFREEHGLDEYYSLYKGFNALCELGAPVLIYKGQNPLRDPTPIRFLKVSDRSLNLLQGKILEGNVLQEGVREFTAHELVWK